MAMKLVERAMLRLAGYRRVNAALDKFGSAVNKAGIRYETGKLRWETIKKHSQDPAPILRALKDKSSSVGKRAATEIETINLARIIRMWSLCNADDIVQTAWEYGYSQERLINLLLKVSDLAGRNRTAALEALPSVMRRGYDELELMELYEMIVKKSSDRACAVFIAIRLENLFPTSEDIKNYMESPAK